MADVKRANLMRAWIWFCPDCGQPNLCLPKNIQDLDEFGNTEKDLNCWNCNQLVAISFPVAPYSDYEWE